LRQDHKRCRNGAYDGKQTELRAHESSPGR
jgi:hypothetical protein